MLSVLFDNEDGLAFNSKRAKQQFKLKVKAIYNSCETEEEFQNKISEQRREILDQYIKQNKYVVPEMDVAVKVDDENVEIMCLLKATENQKEMNKLKYRNKMNELKGVRHMAASQKMVRMEHRKLKKDKRVDKEMLSLYYKACESMSGITEILNPSEILDNVDDARTIFRQYIAGVMTQDNDPQLKQLLLKNPYTDYMKHMTGLSLNGDD